MYTLQDETLNEVLRQDTVDAVAPVEASNEVVNAVVPDESLLHINNAEDTGSVSPSPRKQHSSFDNDDTSISSTTSRSIACQTKVDDNGDLIHDMNAKTIEVRSPNDEINAEGEKKTDSENSSKSHPFQEDNGVSSHVESDSNKAIDSAANMWGFNLVAAAVLVVALWEKIFRALAICALVMMLDLGRQIYERHLGGRVVADDAAAVPEDNQEVDRAPLVQDVADEVINEHEHEAVLRGAVEERDTNESNGAPDLVAEMVQDHV